MSWRSLMGLTPEPLSPKSPKSPQMPTEGSSEDIGNIGDRPQGAGSPLEHSPQPAMGGRTTTGQAPPKVPCSISPESSETPTPDTGDPWPAMYAEWLGGIEEPRAVVTLTDAQAAAAVAAGVVTAETAAASVLVAIRSPLGAAGVLAIPRARYDAFELLRALEAAPWVH